MRAAQPILDGAESAVEESAYQGIRRRGAAGGLKDPGDQLEGYGRADLPAGLPAAQVLHQHDEREGAHRHFALFLGEADEPGVLSADFAPVSRLPHYLDIQFGGPGFAADRDPR